jgi:hypothetical protein
MLVETVKLSRIVSKFTPELTPSLKSKELDSEIVLQYGMEALAIEDVMEIIQFSITELQKDALYH